MAEGWLRHLAGDRYQAASAGVEPGSLNPFAVKAMAEAGVDISNHRAEGIDAYQDRDDIERVIVVCDQASATCPRTWAGGKVTAADGGVMEWFFDDPAAVTGTDEEKLAVFRRVRDQIRGKLEQWLVDG